MENLVDANMSSNFFFSTLDSDMGLILLNGMLFTIFDIIAFMLHAYICNNRYHRETS